jgi:hypothetical protein
LTEEAHIDDKMKYDGGDEPRDSYIASHSVMQDIVEDAFDDENLNKLGA